MSKKSAVSQATKGLKKLKNKNQIHEISKLEFRIGGLENENTNSLNIPENLPKPQMRLYGFSGVGKHVYFDTKDELIKYLKNKNITFGDVCIIEYLGNAAGCSDVIKQITKNRVSLYTAVDYDGYGVYNHERSINSDEFVWEYKHANLFLKDMYSAFRERGIKFTDDIFSKIDEGMDNMLSIMKKADQAFSERQQKSLDQKSKEKSNYDTRLYVDGIPIDDDHIVSKDKAKYDSRLYIDGMPIDEDHMVSREKINKQFAKKPFKGPKKKY